MINGIRIFKWGDTVSAVMSWINGNAGSQCRRGKRRKKRLTVMFNETVIPDGNVSFNETIMFS